MIKKICFALSVLYFFIGYSQNKHNPPIIFYGKVIDKTEYYLNKDNSINTNVIGENGIESELTDYVSYKIEIKRVLKGSDLIDTGTIELLSNMDISLTQSHGGPIYENYSKGEVAIFFSEKNTIATNLNRNTTNSLIIQPYKYWNLLINFNKRGWYALRYHFSLRCKTKEELDEYMYSTYGIRWIEDNGELKEQPKKKCWIKRIFSKKEEPQAN